MLRYIFLLFYFSILLHAIDTNKMKYTYFLDTNNSYNISEVYENRDKLFDFSKKQLSLGFKNDTVWIYLQAHNKTEYPASNVMYFPYPLHDYIYVYKFKNSKIVEKYLTGDLTNFNTRKINDNKFVIPYNLDANSTQEILLKIDSHSALNIDMKFLSTKQYYANAKSSELILGLYYGAVLIMLLYNLILFFMIKAKVYLHYVLFHFFNLFLQLGLNGLAFEYFYPNIPSLNLYFIPLTFSLTNYYVIKFTFSFLNLNNLMPKIINYFKVLSVLSLIVATLTFLLPYYVIILSITLLSMVTAVSLFIVGLYALKKYNNATTKFFVTAWSFLLVGVLLEESLNMGLVEMSFLSLYGAQIGAFIELTLLSLALAYRYNTIYTKLIEKESDLRFLNNELEHKVEERTKKLDTKNHQLNIEVNNKNILLRELYHRVKNNLQIMSSLLSLQAKRIDDPSSKIVFNESIQRIKSIALIHEKLYQSNNLEIISMQEYIQHLVEDLKQSFRGNNLNIEVSCDKISLNIEIAVPIGLIINELITNSLKYAFNDSNKSPNIDIKMQKYEDDTFTLIIGDNGKGVNIETLKEGFGFKLLEFLAIYQLKGKVELYNNSGLVHKMIFSKELLA